VYNKVGTYIPEEKGAKMMINILFGLFFLFLALMLYRIRHVDGMNIWLAGLSGYMAAMDILGLSLTGNSAAVWLLMLGYVFKCGFALCCVLKLVKTKKEAGDHALSRDEDGHSSGIKVERIEKQPPGHISRAG